MTIERKKKQKKEKQIRYQAKKNQKKQQQSMMPKFVSSLSKSVSDSAANITFDSLDGDGHDTKHRDVLDEFLEELLVSDRENWRKWLSIAMLYEFDVDDVLKGVWLYDRSKTTADFYGLLYIF